MLTRPESAATAEAVFFRPQTEALLRTLATQPRSQDQAAAALPIPRAATAIFDALAQPGQAAAALRFFQDPAVRKQLASSPPGLDTQDAFFRALAQTLTQSGGETTARSQVKTPADAARLIQSVLDNPALAANYRALQAAFRIASETRPPATTQDTPQTRQLLAAILQSPEGMASTEKSSALRLLALPQMADAAVEVLQQPAVRDTLARLLVLSAESILPTLRNAPAQTILALAEAGASDAAGKLGTLLNLLAQPGMADTARQVFAFPAARDVLAELLAPGYSPASVRNASANAGPAPDALENTLVILRLLARPEMRDAARDILGRSEVQQRIPRLLMSPEARPLLFAIAAAPGAAPPPALETALLQARQNPPRLDNLPITPDEFVKFPSASAGSQASALPLAINAAAPPPGAAAPPAPAGNTFPPGSLLGVPGPAIIAPNASAVPRPAPEFIAETLFDLFGPGRSRALPTGTRETLQNATEQLARVSPERAGQALRTLNALASLESRNLDTVLRQLSARFQSIGDELALKGGLPPGRTEPTPQTGTLIPLRFENLPEGQLPALARQLAQAGVEVAFAGRSTTGAAQIHLLAAEPSAGGADRAASPFPPGVLQTSNLTAQEQAALAQLFPDTHLQMAIQYGLAASFAALISGAPPPEIAVRERAARDQTVKSPAREAIPSMLDLVRAEPLLLGYEPGELLIPGTDIPLILPPGWDSNPAFEQNT